jgi:hypothetical protein
MHEGCYGPVAPAFAGTRYAKHDAAHFILLETDQFLRNKCARNASVMNCTLVSSGRSQFFLRQRHLSSPVNDGSTTQRCSMTAHPAYPIFRKFFPAA